MNYYKECKIEEILQYWSKILPEIDTNEQLVEFLEETVGLVIENEEIHFRTGSLWDTICKKTEQTVLELENCSDETVVPLNAENFDKWIEPIIEKSINRLSQELKDINELENKEKFILDTYEHLRRELLGVSLRALIYEMNYRKSERIVLEGKVVDFYKEYCMLYQTLKKDADDYIDYLLEIITETQTNKKRIQKELYNGEEIGKLVKIEVELGDKHCNGRTVAILKFEKKSVVFKPRSMEIDAAFQEFIQWVNENMQLPYTLRVMKICKGQTCGWCEYIENRECEDNKLAEFYKKLGTYLCIMYMLNATDMHYENVIADGSDPMFIDLESLLNVSLSKRITEEDKGTDVLTNFFGSSVHQIGLLPHKIKLKNGEIEVGGIGIRKQQDAPLRSLKMVQGEGDSIKLEYYTSKLEGKKNSPKAEEVEISIQDYVSDIITGFELMYKEILIHKDILANRIVQIFKNAKIRVIVKPTMLYANLLQILMHPDFLQVPETKAVLLSRVGLYKTSAESEKSIVQSEIRQLAYNQIPYFYSYFEGDSLYDGCTKGVVCRLKNTAKEMLNIKLHNMSLKDCKRQICLIESSFYERNGELNRTKIEDSYESDVPSESDILQTCEEIAEYVMLRSCTGTNKDGRKERFYWASGVKLIEDNNWSCTLNDMDIYDGNAGIILMLYLLWKKTGKEKYRIYIEESLEPIEELVYSDENSIDKTGFCMGVGGFLFLYSVLMQESAFAEKREGQIKLIRLAELICEKDTVKDFVGGNAGLLASLLYAWKIEKDKNIQLRILQVANKAVSYLMKHDKIELSGFAHGLNGVCPFIYWLYTVEHKEEYLCYVKKLLEVERKKFWLKEERDWRSSFDEKDYAYGWCHGSPGILLGKTLLYKMGFRDEKIEEEMKTAADNLIHKGIGNDMCLCHGDLGNLVILKYYASTVGDYQKLEYSKKKFQDIYQKLIRDSWNDYQYSINKFNGIMIGLSGESAALIFFFLN